MRTSLLAMGLLAIFAGASAQVATTTDEFVDDDIPNTNTYNLDISQPVDDNADKVTPTPVDGVPVTPEPSSASTTSTLEPDASVPPETLSPTTTPTPSETLSPVDATSAPTLAPGGETQAPTEDGEPVEEQPVDEELDDDIIEEVVTDDDTEAEVDTEVTDGAAGAWGSKSSTTCGGAVAVGALGAATLGLY